MHYLIQKHTGWGAPMREYIGLDQNDRCVWRGRESAHAFREKDQAQFEAEHWNDYFAVKGYDERAVAVEVPGDA